MGEKEKAFIYASIQLRINDEKKQTAKLKSAKGRKGGRRR
jgi:hypothetical protein